MAEIAKAGTAEPDQANTCVGNKKVYFSYLHQINSSPTSAFD